MAVDFGNLNSGLRGSSGNTTWRRVRGRTIQSQKRGKNKKAFFETRAAAGLVRSYREALFYIMSNFCDGMQNSINASFEPTKYGSRRNAFFRLNYSAVEKALNGSELGLAVLDQVMHNVSFTGVSIRQESGTAAFNSFDESGWNTLMREAYNAGVTGAYTRSNIGTKVVNTFDTIWNPSTDPGTGRVNEMVVSVGTATTAGQNIERIVIAGTNLALPPTYTIKVGSTQATALTGSWQGNTWRPTGDSATQRWASTYTVYIMDGTRVVYGRDVTFHALSEGAGGE